MLKHRFIYLLIDPRDDKVRYVGVSIDPCRRFKDHCRRQTEQTFCSSWIKSLIQQNLYPVMELIDVVLGSDWEECEKFYILKYRAEGCDLTNLAVGGQGGGHPQTLETRAKIAASAKGNQRGRANKGKNRTPEQRAKIGIAVKASGVVYSGMPASRPAGWHHSPETSARISEAMKARRARERESGDLRTWVRNKHLQKVGAA